MNDHPRTVPHFGYTRRKNMVPCKVVIIIIIPVATHFLPTFPHFTILSSSPASALRLRIVHSFMRSDVFFFLVLLSQQRTAVMCCYAMILLLFVSLFWSGVVVLFVLTGLKEEDQHRPISLPGDGDGCSR